MFEVVKSWTSDIVTRAVGWKGSGGVGHVQMPAIKSFSHTVKIECFFNSLFEKYWKVSFSTYDGHRGGGNVYSIIEKILS